MQKGVYAISVAAKLAGVHPATLRAYERRGLIAPARTPGGRRLFSDDDVAAVRRLRDLFTLGINVEGARRVAELEAEVAMLRRREAK